MRRHRSHIAPFYHQLKTRITITHPFHPQCGRQFELAQYRRSWGREYVDCLDDNGRIVSIQLDWTDAAGEQDPFVVFSAGRSCFRIEDLLRLADLMEKLRR